MVDLVDRTESMGLTEGVLTDEQVIGEPGESPGGLTVGEDTGLEVRHSMNVKSTKEKRPR